jgi:NitT/TauT family transport system substrate-binding protein
MSQSRAPRSAPVPPCARAWRRSAGALGGALVLASALSACSSGSGSLEKSSLKVGYVEGIGAATVNLGVTQQVFAATGLTVTLQSFTSDTAEELALKSGAIDIALGDYTAFLDTKNSPVAGSIQVIGEGYDAGDNTIGLVAANGSSLQGKALTGSSSVSSDIANQDTIVAVPTTDSPEYVALANWQIAEQNPLAQGLSSIHAMQGAGTDDDAAATAMVQAIGSGAAQAAVLQEPYLTQALETGKVVEIADLDTGNANNMPIDGYFTLTTTASSDPNTIAAFQEGLAQAQALGESRSDVEAALTKNGLSQQVASTTSIGNFPSGIVAANVGNIISLMDSAQVQTGNLTPGSLTGGAAS